MLTTCEFFDETVIQKLRALKGKQRHDLVTKIWPEGNAGRGAFDDFACKAIMEHIVRELSQVRHDRSAFAAQNFDAMLAIIQILRERPSEPYRHIVRDLLVQFPNSNSAAVRRSIELTLRVWLTINTHTFDIFVGPISAGDKPVEWPEEESLDRLLQKRFEKRVLSPQQKGYTVFDPTFTATYLVGTCGVRLQWTDDILNHLNFDVCRLTLHVYRHKACVLGHLDGPKNCPLRKDVLEEVLDTMDLLFPPWDLSTKQLLLKEGQQSLYTLGCRRSNRDLHAGHYQYFGEALEHLFETFDKAPRTWRQLAFDRRNKLEWSAFWVTVMVAILTVVSIPCNIIQATYSVKAYQVTLAQGNSVAKGRAGG
jgi:hypothetical protein